MTCMYTWAGSDTNESIGGASRLISCAVPSGRRSNHALAAREDDPVYAHAGVHGGLYGRVRVCVHEVDFTAEWRVLRELNRHSKTERTDLIQNEHKSHWLNLKELLLILDVG